jgi:hypothetical protein
VFAPARTLEVKALADRLLFVWLYGVVPSVLDAVTIVNRRPDPVASEGLFRFVLVLEVAQSWWSAEDTGGDGN